MYLTGCKSDNDALDICSTDRFFADNVRTVPMMPRPEARLRGGEMAYDIRDAVRREIIPVYEGLYTLGCHRHYTWTNPGFSSLTATATGFLCVTV